MRQLAAFYHFIRPQWYKLTRYMTSTNQAWQRFNDSQARIKAFGTLDATMDEPDEVNVVLEFKKRLGSGHLNVGADERQAMSGTSPGIEKLAFDNSYRLHTVR